MFCRMGYASNYTRYMHSIKICVGDSYLRSHLDRFVVCSDMVSV